MVQELFRDLFSIVADTLFPIECLGCGDEGNYICNPCLLTLTRLEQQVCIVCGQISPQGLRHKTCATAETPDSLFSCFDYHNALLSKLIITGKYKFVPPIFRALADYASPMLAEVIKVAQPDFITYIPLHKTRQRWRGFNQAGIIAGSIVSSFDLPIYPTLSRVRAGQVQKNLSKSERLRNLNGIFNPVDTKRINRRRILLIDDVATTGSTLLEATRILKSAGAISIWCITLAREL